MCKNVTHTTRLSRIYFVTFIFNYVNSFMLKLIILWSQKLTFWVILAKLTFTVQDNSKEGRCVNFGVKTN